LDFCHVSGCGFTPDPQQAHIPKPPEKDLGPYSPEKGATLRRIWENKDQGS